MSTSRQQQVIGWKVRKMKERIFVSRGIEIRP